MQDKPSLTICFLGLTTVSPQLWLSVLASAAVWGQKEAEMDWAHPNCLLLAPPLLGLLWWVQSQSNHPMGPRRARCLLSLRSLALLLLIVALAGPASEVTSGRRSLAVVMDHSQSMGEQGLRRVLESARQCVEDSSLDEVHLLRMGREARWIEPKTLEDLPAALAWQQQWGTGSDYGAALELANAVFSPGQSREVLLLGDGHDTSGRLQEMARQLALSGCRISALGLSGPLRGDVRLVSLQPSEQRITEGASVSLLAEVESTVDATATLELFEDSLRVERLDLKLGAGEKRQVKWQRHPAQGGLHRYRAALSDASADALPQNNDALALVEVRGRLRLLCLEADPAQSEGLRRAMLAEGLELEWRQPETLGSTVQALLGYDAVLLIDLPAHRLGEGLMTAMAEYVERFGGGLLMLGGAQSFGVGGYYRSPIDELLPVRLQSPDEEEKQSAAVALVMDRSGSMAGQKLEMAKAAAMATAAVLGRQDWLGVYAFDNEAKAVVPMTRLALSSAVTGQIAALSSGGGTHLMPALEMARAALLRTSAKVRHMIILTDGQTTGSGYESVASQCRADGVTISTVAIGEGSHLGLLQAMAAAGGGQSYTTLDAAAVTRIFTQDTLMHTGRMIREEPFNARQMEQHPMLEGLEIGRAPALLGFVRTTAKVSAAVPLLTDSGEPLLAHWRHGLGKVTAFTSDAKARWGALWMERWPQFGRFWAQVLRETARPVQGRHMDLSLRARGDGVEVHVEALEDAGTRLREPFLAAEWFHSQSDAPGAALTLLKTWNLPQVGSGIYEDRLPVERAGLHLVRVRHGAEMLSAGWVQRAEREASLGTVDHRSLEQAAAITSGRMLRSLSDLPKPDGRQVGSHREHWPLLLALALGCWLADLGVRRWEHVLGLLSVLSARRSATAQPPVAP